MNPSDDKSAAPDGVVVPRYGLVEIVAMALCAHAYPTRTLDERVSPVHSLWQRLIPEAEVAVKAMLAAPPPADSLKGLREALNAMNAAYGGSEYNSTRSPHAEPIRRRIAQIEAAQKESDVSPTGPVMGARSGELAAGPQQAASAYWRGPGRDAFPAQPEAAIGSGGPNFFATEPSSPAAEHCLPAAAAFSDILAAIVYTRQRL